MKNLRGLPSVEHILQDDQVQILSQQFGRNATLEAVRSILDDIRIDKINGLPNMAEVISFTRAALEKRYTFSLQSVINATGVVLHTNLGRAPLSKAALLAINSTSGQYSNLEYDLQTGARGSRHVHAGDLINQLTGSESALIVNNNAGAVLLALSSLAARKKTIISRTQLVEIGGGFRIPDVMRQSGAKLVEIGTTNRVHLEDYRAALEAGARVVVRAHPSNFKIIGFTSEPSLEEITTLAHQFDAIVIDDLGSGCLLDTARFGLAHEQTVQESLQAGVDVVCFSGDKLLGGPQAGILAGRKDLIDKIKKHPLARAVRADKLCLAATTATLFHYIKEEAEIKIPIWSMISQPLDVIKNRADYWQTLLKFGLVVSGFSTIGGGSLPGETLPTWLFSIAVRHPQKVLAFLRAKPIPVIARVEADQILFDPRTVLPEQDELLAGILAGIPEKEIIHEI